MSTPVFYTFGGSVWSAVPELAIRELGYKLGDIDKVTINLVEGENFKPTFIKLNPHATLPTLTADGKIYLNTIDVTKYLLEHAPQTPGAASSTEFVKRVHEDDIDPNFAMLAARTDEELGEKAKGLPLLFLRGRQATLERLSCDPAASEHSDLYQAKIAGNGGLKSIYEGLAPLQAKNGFFDTSTKHWASICSFVLSELPPVLPDEGFIGGEKPGEDDFHLGAWLARIVGVLGGDDVSALAAELGQDVPEKVVKYWKTWSERESWKIVYAEGLH